MLVLETMLGFVWAWVVLGCKGVGNLAIGEYVFDGVPHQSLLMA